VLEVIHAFPRAVKSGSSFGGGSGHDGHVETLRGHLLIAGSSLWDPNFRRAVVLIGHHDADGAVGVVLNRTAGVTVAEAVPPLASLVPDDAPLFLGGPVQPQSAVVVADFDEPERAEIVALDSIGFLPPETGPEDLGGIRRARVFAGYAGWGAGQLEAELHEDSWVIEPALADDVFSPQPDRLWDTVLRRKGPAFDLLRLMPLDPSAN
jgi:putative transcriptional regulator